MRTIQRNRKDGKKFMQVLSLTTWNDLRERSVKRGITVQEYIRAIVIPEFLEAHPVNPIRRKMIKDKQKSLSARKAWNTRRINLANKRKEQAQVEVPTSATKPIGSYTLPPLPPRPLSQMEAGA